MTQEDKTLLLKALCARLPYGVIVKQGCYEGKLTSFDKYTLSFNSSCALPKPYLRPMSSMTDEERKEYKHHVAFSGSPNGAANFVDWLNKHYFDYRNLIEKGLALEAPKDMYKL